MNDIIYRDEDENTPSDELNIIKNGLYREGERNTTDHELNRIASKVLEFKSHNFQSVYDDLLTIINDCTERTFIDGLEATHK